MSCGAKPYTRTALAASEATDTSGVPAASGEVISTVDDLVTLMQAIVGAGESVSAGRRSTWPSVNDPAGAPAQMTERMKGAASQTRWLERMLLFIE